MDPEANIIWGAQLDPSLQSTVRTTIVVSGINSDEDIDVDFEEDNDESGEDDQNTADQLDDFIDGIF